MNTGRKITPNFLLVLPLCTVFLFTSMPSQNLVGAFAPSAAMASGDGGGSESGGGDGGGEFEGPRSRRKKAPKRDLLLRRSTPLSRIRGVNTRVDPEIVVLARRIQDLIQTLIGTRLTIRLVGNRDSAKESIELEKKSQAALFAAIVQLEIYMRLKGLESPAMAVLRRNTRTAKKAIR